MIAQNAGVPLRKMQKFRCVICRSSVAQNAEVSLRDMQIICDEVTFVKRIFQHLFEK